MVFSKLFKKNKSPKNDGTGELDLPYTLVTKFYLNGKGIKGKPLYELTESHIIGSVEGDILIEDKNVSAKHLEIHVTDGVVTITDLSSEAGTSVNKKAINPGKKVILRDGDDIRLGKLKLVFEEVDEEVPDLDAQADMQETTLAQTTENPADDLTDTPPDEKNEEKNEEEHEEITEEQVAQTPQEAPSGEDPDDQLKEVVEEEASEGLKVATSIIKSGPVKEESAKEKTFKLQLYDYNESQEDVEAQNNSKKDIKSINLRKQKTDKIKTKKAVAGPSANAFFRLLALVTDIIFFALIIENIPQKTMLLIEIDKGIKFVLDKLVPLFKTHALKYVDLAYAKVPALVKIQETIVNAYQEEHFLYIQYLILLIGFQLVCTFLFGVSLGQFLFGIKAKGNFVLKRILGVFRVILNYLLLPFFVLFELPTLFSKRSFKEILSFTQLEMVSKLRVFLTLFLIFPLMGLGFIVAPLLENFTVPKAIIVESQDELKLEKVSTKFTHYSQALKLTVDRSNTLSLLPKLKVVQVDGKKSVQMGFVGIIKENDKVESVEILRDVKLNLSKFFLNYTKLNPFVYLKYKTLLDVVHDASNDNPNFKSKSFPNQAFATELIGVLKGAFSFSIDDPSQSIEFLKAHGPFFIAHMDVRNNLLNLVSNPVTKIEISQVGSSFSLLIYTQAGKKNFLRIIPLNGNKVYSYKVQYESAQALERVLKFDYNSENSQNLPSFSVAGFLDIISGDNEIESAQVFQQLYQSLYSFGMKSLSDQDEKSLALLQSSIRDTIELFENKLDSIKVKKSVKDKLVQNLNDLLQAIVDKDNKFFGIENSKVKTI